MNPEFQVHKLNPLGLARANQVAESFNRLLDELQGLMPSGRELSIVKTKLEEASFFAKKGIAKNPYNQQ